MIRSTTLFVATLAAALCQADEPYELPDPAVLLNDAPARESVIAVGQGPFSGHLVLDGRLVLVS